MRCAINQPHYLPWLPYLVRMQAVDVFILWDDVQFERHGWQNRTQIRSQTGAQWLTVPVRRPWWQPINCMKICRQEPWARSHWRALVSNYKPAPYFRDYGELFREGLLERSWDSLLKVDVHFLKVLRAAFGISNEMYLASEFSAGVERDARLVALCQGVGATVYLSGVGERNQAREKTFGDAGIQVEYQRFEQPVYQQVFRGSFIPNLSAIDFLFNCGREGWEKVTALGSSRSPHLA